MKKALVCLMALSLIVAFSATVFAAAESGIKTFGTGGGDTCTYGLSNNVFMDYAEADAGQNFALGDKHRSGNREFFTTNNTTLIYYFEADSYKGSTTLANGSAGLVPSATSVSGGTAL